MFTFDLSGGDPATAPRQSSARTQTRREVSPAGRPCPHPTLHDQPLLDVLRLIRSEHVGPITCFKLVGRYGSASKALEALPMLAARGGAKRSIRVCSRAKAEAEMERTAQFGARFVAYGDPNYPPLLTQIPDPPPLLAVMGHPHLLGQSTPLAMVGSRNASANGARFAASLATALGEAGYVIASGMARGIDGHTHQAALTHGTIGVIAGGIDHIYPPEHAALYDRVIAEGTLVSEAPFASTPQHRHFPARNRIIAGLAPATVVVEATKKSGSLITARCALDYNREVFAVPGFPLDPRAAGTNQLIQDGACLVSRAEDILETLAQHRSDPHFGDTALREGRSAPPWQQHHEDAEAAGATIPADDETQHLTRERASLLALLSASPTSVAYLSEACGLPTALMHALLIELELAGHVQRHPGGHVSRHYTEEKTAADIPISVQK